MVLCSLIAIMSGGRGPFLSWVIVNIVALFMLFIKKERKVIAGIGLSAAAVVVCVLAAPPDNAAVNRQFVFMHEVENGDLKQSVVSDDAQKLLDEIYNSSNSAGGMKGVIEKIQNNQEAGVDDEQFKEIVYAVTNGSMARSYLWQLAIKETLRKPLIGMGALGFQLKYGTYPHNVLLECLSDFGIPAFIMFAGMCGTLIFLMFRHSIKNRKFWNLIIILVTPAIQSMISGNLYGFSFLLFAGTVVIWQSLEC